MVVSEELAEPAECAVIDEGQPENILGVVQAAKSPGVY